MAIYKQKNKVLEQIRFAADNSDWQGFTLAMGGLHTKQKDRPLQLHYDLNINEQTGECLQSYYDKLILKIKGLWFAGKAVVTLHYQWKIEKHKRLRLKPKVAQNEALVSRLPEWQRCFYLEFCK